MAFEADIKRPSKSLDLGTFVEYARTGDGSDFWHVQDESGFSDPYYSQTIGHEGIVGAK